MLFWTFEIKNVTRRRSEGGGDVALEVVMFLAFNANIFVSSSLPPSPRIKKLLFKRRTEENIVLLERMPRAEFFSL